MKTLRSLLTLAVLFTALTAFAGITDLPDLNFTFAAGSKAVITATPVKGATKTVWLSPYEGPFNSATSNVATVPAITKTQQGMWSVATQINGVFANIARQYINVTVTTNATAPDLTVTGAIGTGAAAVANVYFTVSGTQSTAVTFAVRGAGLGTAGLATPRVQVLNATGKAIGEGYVLVGGITDIVQSYLYMQAFGKSWNLVKGDACLTLNLAPGIYTVVVSSKTAGKTGTFELDMADFR